MSYSPEYVEQIASYRHREGCHTSGDMLRAYAATLRQAARVDEGLVPLAEQGAELASDMAYEANQQNSQELADRAALVHRLATALSAQPACVCCHGLGYRYERGEPIPCDLCDASDSAQPAERQGEAGDVVELRDKLIELFYRNSQLGREDDAALADEVLELVYTHPAAPVGVPDGWVDAYAAFKGAFDTPLARLKDDSEYANDARRRLRELNEAMLAAAPSAPQADRRTNYVSGSVDGSGKFQPTQQDPSAPQGVECKCSLRQRLVGDGCQVCNPKLAAELAADSTHPTERK